MMGVANGMFGEYRGVLGRFEAGFLEIMGWDFLGVEILYGKGN